MSPFLKYTVARLGLFAVVLLALWPVPGPSTLLKLMIAVLVSALLGWFLLRRMRDEVANHVERTVERRRQEKEKLRSALSGDDEEPMR